MTPVSAMIMFYITTGMIVGGVAGWVLNHPGHTGKMARQFTEMEKEFFDRGLDPALIPIMLCILWPMVLFPPRA